MSIRNKIIAFQVIVALLLLSTGGGTYFAIERIDYYFDRSRLARAQMDTVIRLSAHMNRYSENIAEMLLLGRTELDDFYVARASLEDSFDLLTDMVEEEISFVRSSDERDEEQEELVRVRAMRELYESIDLTAERLMVLRDSGRQAEAVALFRDDIENRMDEELERYISAAIADETEELEVIQTRTNQLEQQLTILVIAICFAALGVSLVAGTMLTRALTRPIRALISGAQAIGDGNLGYRITYDRKDEFSDLADQFNTTAAQLEAQRNQLLEVQSGLETEIGQRINQLEEANSRLKKLDEMRMLFLADIGHELRTPLTVLRGEAEIVLRGNKVVEDYRETLSRIVGLTGQMGRLIEDLLFLSRAEVGAIRFEMEPLVLRDVFEVALGEARVLAAETGVLLQATIDEPFCKVEGDAERLTQAFLIVLDNAIKYSKRGASVDVTLCSTRHDAVVSVRNAGASIPANDLPFVFHRFYRGHQSDNRPTVGSGLGLPIAKWITDTHGGNIFLKSADCETVVTFRFPLIA
ncbi:HAMP domain-containing protein [Paracoccus liaowanqingii]|uniref:histidine kinase n=1 Tax=Paracoccus liaowanqingii TaxID=2560053 RepID=A0A4Z1C054_9RHOB|nr:ATP-binding protein [Paracoccus liaowanqingii]TGN61611.1 HAMP domain-containing protein [Paracoccus liaowanqingii]